MSQTKVFSRYIHLLHHKKLHQQVHICGIAGLSESRVFVQVLVTEHTLQHSTELQVLRIGRHCVRTVVSHVNVSGHLIKANQIIEQAVKQLSSLVLIISYQKRFHFTR